MFFSLCSGGNRLDGSRSARQLYASDNIKVYPIAKAILITGFLVQIIAFGIFGICAVLCSFLLLAMLLRHRN